MKRFLVLESIVIVTLLFTACQSDSAAEPTVPPLAVVEETASPTAQVSPQPSRIVPTAAPSPTATLFPTQQNCTPRTDWQTYTVQRGDSLTAIAGLVGSSVSELAAANCLADASLIREGQQLYVPNLPPPTATSPGIPQIVSFSANAASVPAGGEITVSWQVINAPDSVLMRRERLEVGSSATAMPPEDFAMLPDTGSQTFTANTAGLRERFILIVYGGGERLEQIVDVQVTVPTEESTE